MLYDLPLCMKASVPQTDFCYCWYELGLCFKTESLISTQKS